MQTEVVDGTADTKGCRIVRFTVNDTTNNLGKCSIATVIF